MTWNKILAIGLIFFLFGLTGYIYINLNEWNQKNIELQQPREFHVRYGADVTLTSTVDIDLTVYYPRSTLIVDDEVIIDGLAAYQLAYKREFWTREKATRTEHVRDIHISGGKNNNKMERLNGEIRDREKVVRGLKKRDSPVLTGYQIYHNYVRPHEGLKGKTPADACGIEVKGENKWKTLIENANLLKRTSI